MQTRLTEYEFRRHSEEPFGHDAADFNGLRLGHVALHNSPNQNAGDTLLPQAVRGAFDLVAGRFGWHYLHLWDKCTRRDIDFYNRELDGLVIGGGGFIIKDQWGADIRRSGWSWNLTLEDLERLETPFCLFAVGYNRFRNQEDFEPHFREHITRTVQKAVFVGMRNRGSIRRVSEYLLEPGLADKMKLQFCPTTISTQIWPAHARTAGDSEAGFAGRRPVLAFNFAGDRLEMRFGGAVEEGMTRLAGAVRKMEAQGWDVVLTAHKQIDRQIEPYLDRAGVTYATHDLTYAEYREILDFYARVDLAVGMRGHGQMIPLGLRKPIVSIISHDKMGYLLEDIGHPEWGVDVEREGWEEALPALVEETGLRRREKTLAAIGAAQDACWENTKANVEFVAGEFQRIKRERSGV